MIAPTSTFKASIYLSIYLSVGRSVTDWLTVCLNDVERPCRPPRVTTTQPESSPLVPSKAKSHDVCFVIWNWWEGCESWASCVKNSELTAGQRCDAVQPRTLWRLCSIAMRRMDRLAVATVVCVSFFIGKFEPRRLKRQLRTFSHPRRFTGYIHVAELIRKGVVVLIENCHSRVSRWISRVWKHHAVTLWNCVEIVANSGQMCNKCFFKKKKLGWTSSFTEVEMFQHFYFFKVIPH